MIGPEPPFQYLICKESSSKYCDAISFRASFLVEFLSFHLTTLQESKMDKNETNRTDFIVNYELITLKITFFSTDKTIINNLI
jgi:hypothetical protein